MREPRYSILADIQDAIERAKQGKLALYWQRTIQREYRCKKVTPAEQQAYEQLQSILSEIPQWSDEEDLHSDMEEIGGRVWYCHYWEEHYSMVELTEDRNGKFNVDYVLDDAVTPEVRREAALLAQKELAECMQELTKENLLSNFTLKGKPSNIDFDHLDSNLAQVDLDGDGTPRASKMESHYQQFIGQQFPLMPSENRLKLCRNIIHTTLSRQKKLNAVDDTELQRYVDYIIDGMNQDQLDALEQMPVNFANKICDYIIKLQEETARENFYNWLEVGKIVTEPRFKLTPHITLSGKASSLTKSLYKQECELDDNFEYDMAMALTGIDSVRWWHRNPTSGRNAFCLNAFRNHYPDFIVMTNSGKVLLVETKGDQLENAESREKIKLGRAWQNAAGSQYRYYMVFQNKDLHLDGAYRFDEFLKILGEL